MLLERMNILVEDVRSLRHDMAIIKFHMASKLTQPDEQLPAKLPLLSIEDMQLLNSRMEDPIVYRKMVRKYLHKYMFPFL